MTPDDLHARRPVWGALSDVYLDTDVDDVYPHAARVLADSGYTLDELRDILCHEVHPVLHPNLLAVAGVWAGSTKTGWSNASCSGWRNRAGGGRSAAYSAACRTRSGRSSHQWWWPSARQEALPA